MRCDAEEILVDPMVMCEADSEPRLITSEVGVVSPGYPDKYPTDADCYMSFHSNNTHHLRIEIVRMKLEDNYDMLKVRLPHGNQSAVPFALFRPDLRNSISSFSSHKPFFS